MAKQVQIRKVEERQARKFYACQCGQEGCQERIEKGELYKLFKLVEKEDLTGFKNREKKISRHCSWFKKWEEFLK